MRDVVLVPGPMHPDMFDGETPIMVPVKRPKVYDVRITFTQYESVKYSIAAHSEEAAGDAALELAEGQEEGEDFEVDDIDLLARAPTDEELAAFRNRYQVSKKAAAA